MNWLFYFLGVALHVAFKWSGWKAKNRSATWLAYWQDYAALNIQAAVAAAACMFLWEQGWIALAINAGVQQVLAPVLRTELPALTVTPLSSLACGYMLDSLGRTLLMALGTRIQRTED